MKTLFKLFLSLIIFVLILVFGLLFAISGVNNTPIDIYTDDAINSNILNDKLNYELNSLGDDNSLNLHFSDRELNLLIFNLIRENINPDYSPLLGTSDNEKYIYTYVLDNSISVIGGKSIHVYSVYTSIDDNSLNVEIPVDLFGIVDSKVSMDLMLKSSDDDFIFHINSLKLGRINLLGSLGSSILNMINLDTTNSFFTIDLGNKEIIINKEKLSAYLNNSISSNNEDSFAINELVSIILNPEYHILNINLEDKQLKLDVDLNVITIDKDKVIIEEAIKEEFDSNLFITNKTQNLMFSSLSSSNTNLIFSYNEINQLIYTLTEGYKNLCCSVPINDDVRFDISIESIILDNTDGILFFHIILNLNGMYTKVVIPCNMTKPSDTEIKLTIGNKLSLGDKLSGGGSVSVSSDFIYPILEEGLKNLEILKYNNSDKSFTIDSSILDSFLDSNQITSNFEIKALNLTSLGLIINIELTSNEIQNKVDNLTNGFKDLFSSDFINSDLFGITSTDEEEKVNELLDTLDDISNVLNSDESLSSAQTDKLIKDINSLSSENQQIIYDQIQNSLSSDDMSILESLYNDLFK